LDSPTLGGELVPPPRSAMSGVPTKNPCHAASPCCITPLNAPGDPHSAITPGASMARAIQGPLSAGLRITPLSAREGAEEATQRVLNRPLRSLLFFAAGRGGGGVSSFSPVSSLLNSIPRWAAGDRSETVLFNEDLVERSPPPSVEPFSGAQEEGPTSASGRVPRYPSAGPAGARVSGGSALRGPPLLPSPRTVGVASSSRDRAPPPALSFSLAFITAKRRWAARPLDTQAAAAPERMPGKEAKVRAQRTLRHHRRALLRPMGAVATPMAATAHFSNRKPT